MNDRERLEKELGYLANCGCENCKCRYYKLREELIGYNYIPYHPPALTREVIYSLMTTGQQEKPKVEEPKNIAVALLVKKLKVEQEQLANYQASINKVKAELKGHTDNKNKNLKNIKELSDALKKLGHKEVKSNA